MSADPETNPNERTVLYRRAIEENRLLADIARNLPFQALLVDPHGTISLMTDIGLRAQEARGAPNPIGLPFDDFLRPLFQNEDVFIDGKSNDEAFALLGYAALIDGAEIEYSTRLGRVMHRRSIRLADGSFLLIGTDVTAERQTQQIVVSERSRLQAIMDTTQSSIVGLSQSGQVAFLNNAARHMLGGTMAETPFDWPTAIKFLDAGTLAPLDASADPVQRALSGVPLASETALMSRTQDDREPRYVRLTSVRRTAKTANDIATILSFDDVSELEKNRQQAERSQRLDALGQLTGGVAHDFNNILATIQYAAQLIEGNVTDDSSDGYLKTIQSSVGRGSELTQRLLAFAKRQPGRAASVFVGSVLDEFSGLAKPLIEETVDLNFAPPSEDLWVFCDVPQLENALLNLVINSRDSFPSDRVDAKITVTARGVAEIDSDSTLRREDPASYIARGLDIHGPQNQNDQTDKAYRYVEFSVTDNGPGMPEEIRRRAVDPFFTTKNEDSGTGLGLSMVYGFIQQAGGELRIYSEEGVGTTVRLLVPRGEEKGGRELPVERLPEATGAQQRILIAEDEPALLAAMAEIIGSLGYVVIPAKNGREALTMIEDGLEIDLLLTDVVMPGGVGGFELAREARRILPTVPVLYMSGYAGFTEEQIGDVQAPLLQKPCPPAELAKAIQQAL